ncbi:hypothetical protein HY478_01395, partial [Candidatus Uhrbacteria bacterium]|nr:hypothetical protein [Candidatus Uhrbacteria bacterium]
MSGEQRTTDLLSQKEADTVAVLTEMAFDAHFFDEGAWMNLLAFLKKNPCGVIVDGALTRLDRPEILNDELTFWTKSEEECDVASGEVKNRERLQHMLGIQYRILAKRMKELRQALGPKAQIFLSMRGDDVHGSLSALLHEILLLRGDKCEEKIGELQQKRGALGKQAKGLAKTKQNLAKGVKPGAKLSVKVARKLAVVEKELGNIGAAVGKLDGEIAATKKEMQYAREPKAGPRHQCETRKLIEGFYASVGAICKSVGAEFTYEQKMLSFGDLRINWDHNGNEKSWGAILRIEECLVAGTHGKMQRARSNVGVALKEFVRAAEKTHPDVILRGGHDGRCFWRMQRLKTTPDELNYKTQMLYDSERIDDCVTLVCAPPFENQERIGRFVKGAESVRMSGGKPLNTRSHEVFKRYSNGGVSGVLFFSKSKGAPKGFVGMRCIQYYDFLTGAVLDQPSEFAAFSASADEHIGVREAEDMTRDGFVEMHKTYLTKPLVICGQRAVIKGYV